MSKKIDAAWIQDLLDQPMGRKFKRQSPRITLASGGRISVQASATHYCSPKRDTGPYNSVEIMPEGVEVWSTASVDYLEKFGRSSDDVVWGWLAIKDVVEVINLNGGVVDGS